MPSHTFVPDGRPANFGPQHEQQEPCIGVGVGAGVSGYLRNAAYSNFAGKNLFDGVECLVRRRVAKV